MARPIRPCHVAPSATRLRRSPLSANPRTQALLGADAPAGSTNIKVKTSPISPRRQDHALDVDSSATASRRSPSRAWATQAVRMSSARSCRLPAPPAFKYARLPWREHRRGRRSGQSSHPSDLQTERSPQSTDSGAGGTTSPSHPSQSSSCSRRKRHAARHRPGADRAAQVPPLGEPSVSATAVPITFQPALPLPHSSNDPSRRYEHRITLDSAVAKDHATTPWYTRFRGDRPQVTRERPSPTSGSVVQHSPRCRQAIVLRDAAGLARGQPQLGLVVDPGPRKASTGQHPTETSWLPRTGQWAQVVAASAARPRPSASLPQCGPLSDGADTDSNCKDFHVQTAATWPLLLLPARRTSSGERGRLPRARPS